MIAPPNLDSPDRLAALRRLGILDGPAEPAYDRVVELAAKLCNAPIALITFVDDQRQWFKARVGIEIDETSAEVSFCGHVLTALDPILAIDDTAADVRFHDNPHVTGHPRIGAYAGTAIHAPSGEPIGTVCVLDHTPRSWTATHLEVLVDLAAIVDQLIAKHEHPQPAARDISKFVEIMLATVHDGVVVQDTDGRIIRWNRAAERALGLTPDELSGRTSFDPRWGAIRADGSEWPGDSHPAIQALNSGAAVHDQTMGIHRPADGLVWLRVNSTPITDEHGAVTGALTTFVDLTSSRDETIPTGTPTSLTTTDRQNLLDHLERLLEAIELAGTTLAHETALTESIISSLRAGATPLAAMSTIDITNGRDQLSKALSTLEEARRLGRAAMFRSLLDDGTTIAELATMWGISKQLVYRTVSKSIPPADG